MPGGWEGVWYLTLGNQETRVSRLDLCDSPTLVCPDLTPRGGGVRIGGLWDVVPPEGGVLMNEVVPL